MEPRQPPLPEVLARPVASASLLADPPASGTQLAETPDRAALDAAVPAAQQGLTDLYDIGRLADRLGVEHATIRVWLSRKVPWLPAPDGKLNGGAVWRATTLEGIEQRRAPGRPGPKPRTVPPTA